MLFAVRALSVAKDANFPQGYEDAFAFDAETGIAAVADGVSTAIFCSLWAKIITRAVVASPPDPQDASAFNRWLAEHRSEWLKQIDFPNLTPNQQVKVRRTGGAYCTLTWVQITDSSDPETGDRFSWRAFGLGDSCLLHLRDGEVLTRFPLENSAEFDADPDVLGSVDFQRTVEFKQGHAEGRNGDWVILCTDAVAQWIYRRLEAGDAVPWKDFWSFDDATWNNWIEELRQSGTIVRDDSTMLLLRFGTAVDDPSEPQDIETATINEVIEAVPDQVQPSESDSASAPKCDSQIVP